MNKNYFVIIYELDIDEKNSNKVNKIERFRTMEKLWVFFTR